MEQEKSLVTTGAHNESETTALLVHIDAPSHTTQTATTTTTTATSAVEARVTTMWFRPDKSHQIYKQTLIKINHFCSVMK